MFQISTIGNNKTKALITKQHLLQRGDVHNFVYIKYTTHTDKLLGIIQ